MTKLLLICGGILAVIVIVALMLPCEACRLRRERMKQAYAAWQTAKKER